MDGRISGAPRRDASLNSLKSIRIVLVHSMASTSSASVIPNHTLYVSYVYDKLNKEVTKKVLHALFGQFGRVIDVVYSKTLRGRAWIVFEDVSSASQARNNLQDFELYGRPLKIDFALTKSDAVAKLDGTWRQDGRTRKVRYGIEDVDGMDGIDGIERMDGTDGRGGGGGSGGAGWKRKAPVATAGVIGEPNKTLFVENLPEGTREEMVKVLFGQFPGYSAARMVPGKPGLAFVDFESEQQAGIALTGLQGFKIGASHEMVLSYAKKEKSV
jgi:U2 small nuclear ribonucleoprotein B''